MDTYLFLRSCVIIVFDTKTKCKEVGTSVANTDNTFSVIRAICPDLDIQPVVIESKRSPTCEKRSVKRRPQRTRYTGAEVVSAEKQSPPLPSLRAHYSRFSNYFMKNRQSTCKCTISVQFTYLEKLLSNRKNGNGGDCISTETNSGPVRVYTLFLKAYPTHCSSKWWLIW
jgi:hypothetical protein